MRILSIVLIAIIPLCSMAQKDKYAEALETAPEMTVSQGSYKMKKELRPAFTTVIIADEDDVEKKWKNFVEDRYKCDFKKSKGIYEAPGIKMPEVTIETVSLYSAFEETARGTKLIVLVDLGGKFVDGGAEADKLKRMMSGFLTNFYDLQYTELIDDQTKDLDKATKAVAKLVKEGEKLTKSVASEHQAIEKSNEGISKSQNDIESLNKKIEELQNSIKESEKKIQELEADIERNAKSTESSKQAEAMQKTRVEKLNQNHEAIRSRK